MSKSKPKEKIESTEIDPKFAVPEPDEVLVNLQTKRRGLTHAEYVKRLATYGPNDTGERKMSAILVFVKQLVSPLTLILFVIALLSYIFAEKLSAFIVFAMALLSVIISFIQEHKAGNDAKRLIEMVKVTCQVIRDSKKITLDFKHVVPGDIVALSAGDMVPADLRIIEANDLFINQSTFTGESFPVEKNPFPIKYASITISNASNFVFMGSSVVSGNALGVVCYTGNDTEFGKISKRLKANAEETAFDVGIKRFTWLMVKFMVVLGILVFAINFIAKGDPVDAFLFALAVAVGLAPEMLPMIVTINLSKGAIDMSRKEVIVKRLDAMQNFGAMDILCTDKTGTLTMDEIVLMHHSNALGQEDEDVLRHAYLNSYYQTGLNNLLDKAVLKHDHLKVREFKKVDEIPFDFNRRVLSVVIRFDHHLRMITKGAPEEIFKRCFSYEADGRVDKLSKDMIERLEAEYQRYSADGFRVLAVAYRDFDLSKDRFTKDDEIDLVFKGYVAFLDPPKPTVAETITKLHSLGIDLKILSGDNELVTKKVCSDVNLEISGMLTGAQISKLSDSELKGKVEHTTVFSRLDPLQKERVINALRTNKHAVGFMGDGINDAPALKAADVGISVNNAVGVAKETADIILLRKSLTVLADCVVEGRKTFGNIIKYVKMGASSNFGNMFSMTGASLLLPFLPMLPMQILFNNFLYDIAQITLPSDQVDEEYVAKPRPWDIKFIEKFMVYIGPLSSIYDFLTFGLMWYVIGANVIEKASIFQTGWFLESLCSQLLVIFIIRTNKKPFLESWPSRLLMMAIAFVIIFAFSFANSSWGYLLGFTALPWQYFVILFVMIITYLLLVQKVKTWFIGRFGLA